MNRITTLLVRLSPFIIAVAAAAPKIQLLGMYWD